MRARAPGTLADLRVRETAVLHGAVHGYCTTRLRTYDELCGQFGDEIADIVTEVTDTKWLAKTGAQAPASQQSQGN